MFKPRNIVTWGDRLKWKRSSNNPHLDGEVRCMYHLMIVGVFQKFDLTNAEFHWDTTLGMDCEICAGAKTCSYFESEE